MLGVWLLCLAAGALAAQPRLSVMDDAGKANLPAQPLGVGDLIAVSVYDAPELTRTLRVEPDGQVHLPLLDAGVPAAGRMPRELEADIALALRSGEVLVNPIVKVTVVEYHSRPISVLGAVRKPLTFQAEPGVTLLEALARAEGFSSEAGADVLVRRGAEVHHIPVHALLEAADPAANLTLSGGEEIRVLEAGKITVVGNVRRPGVFPVREAGGLSVLRLIALSEGLAPYAEKRAFILRRDASGRVAELPVELDRILKREAPDPALQAGDILYIPDNQRRRTTMSILDRVTSFGASTASGVLIWRR
jgi:polysaccharide export outer membrane protein